MADNEGHSKEHEFTIIVNTREREVTSDVLTYDQVVALAFDPVPTDKDITISYRDAAAPKRQGTLLPNESVTIKHQGTTFIVTATNKA